MRSICLSRVVCYGYPFMWHNRAYLFFGKDKACFHTDCISELTQYEDDALCHKTHTVQMIGLFSVCRFNDSKDH